MAKYDETWEVTDPRDFVQRRQMEENFNVGTRRVAVVVKSPEAMAFFKNLMSNK